MRIAFVHPDLGLGGAERFIIDAALSLQTLGHEPTIFTPFRDASRCFREVAPPSPEISVRVVRSAVPRSLFGRLQAILAALRCALLAFYVCLFHRFDVAVVDIVSLPVLVFALFRKPVLFYCHYPDKLLAATLRHPAVPQSRLKKAYRRVVDAIEEFSLRFATSICCNSRFTRRVFVETFPRLRTPAVVYPCVVIPDEDEPRQPEKLLLSLNRFERKKSISLAIETLSVLVDREPAAKDLKLVVAGGYDPRLQENVEYFEELERLVAARKLSTRVTILRNVPDAKRRRLICRSLAVLYTPSNEHFGIVPLEAMAEGVPVIAVNSGGPVESVESGECGVLCESSANAFSNAVLPLLKDTSLSLQMGKKGRERMQRYFSRKVLGRELQNVLLRMVDS